MSHLVKQGYLHTRRGSTGRVSQRRRSRWHTTPASATAMATGGSPRVVILGGGVEELGVDIGYRKVTTASVTAGAAKPRKAPIAHNAPSWLDGNIAGYRELATVNDDTTAQVHPHKLTSALMAAATQLGAGLRIGCVQGLEVSEDGRVQGVRVDGDVIPADVVVVAMGPWSSQAARWFSRPVPVTGQRYHSIVLKPSLPISAHCLFLSYRSKSGQVKDPEVYPRPDGTVYVCGEAGRPMQGKGIPDIPSDLPVDPDACSSLQGVATSISSSLNEVMQSQACCLPLSSDDLPMIGPVPGVEGAYIATGHGCWGILNGPLTGKLIAELIVHGAAQSLDISHFDPARLMSQL
ncbi:hypothetical protein WJX72_004001 [[Myrmecia] bisecta]|uniref:FAD dependent oxidoreductase domain-containing protein n=1 Tax=[Myrmecia] bisecta TaxID=41462 RepID=A0AAW1PSS5_9CHLO